MIASRATLLGQEIRNVFYYRVVGTPDPANFQAYVDALDTAWKGAMQSGHVGAYNQYGYDIKDAEIPGQPTAFIVPTAGAWSGTASGEPVPAQIAGLVSFRSSTPPPNKGRKYLAGLGENALVNGRWGPTLLGFLEDWGNAVIEIDAGLGTDPDLAAVELTGSPPIVTSSNEFTFSSATDNPATQRRRRLGLGI